MYWSYLYNSPLELPQGFTVTRLRAVKGSCGRPAACYLRKPRGKHTWGADVSWSTGMNMNGRQVLAPSSTCGGVNDVQHHSSSQSHREARHWLIYTIHGYMQMESVCEHQTHEGMGNCWTQQHTQISITQPLYLQDYSHTHTHTHQGTYWSLLLLYNTLKVV